MFCIAAFIVLAILGIFSASYRQLAWKAWYCVARKLTFRPCDINFAEEVKGKILGKLIIRRPKLAKFLDKWIDLLSFVFVVLTVWSLISVALAGLNLWVYDTCDPVKSESCSLSGEACGIDKTELGFVEAIQTGKITQWVSQPFVNFAETVSRVPDRFKNWNPEEYLSKTATFYQPYDSSKEYALEAIDPGCIYCKRLFGNIKQAGFEKTHNLSYLIYPIADSTQPGGFKFKNSPLMASFIEASKKVTPANKKSDVAPDWQIIEKIFTGKDSDGTDWQVKFDMIFTDQEARTQLKIFLVDVGYTDQQAQEIEKLAASSEVQESLKAQRDIVENKLKTVKIPTILFGGRRFDRLIDVNAFK